MIDNKWLLKGNIAEEFNDLQTCRMTRTLHALVRCVDDRNTDADGIVAADSWDRAGIAIEGDALAAMYAAIRDAASLEDARDAADCIAVIYSILHDDDLDPIERGEEIVDNAIPATGRFLRLIPEVNRSYTGSVPFADTDEE